MVDLLERIIPFNTRFRPIGAYETTPEYMVDHAKSGVKHHVIFSKYKIELPVPRDLYENLSSYFTYDKVDLSGEDPIFRTENDYVVVKIPNGRIYSNNVNMVACMTADDYLLGDISYQYSTKRSLKAIENGIFSRSWFPKPRYIKGTVFNMLAGGGSTYNYGHWIIDAIPRLHLLDLAGLLGEIDFVLVPAYKYDYHKDMLAMFGFGPEKIIVADSHTHIQADRLISSSHPRGNRSYLVPKWIVECHRNRFLLPAQSYKDKFPEKVYISRKDTKLRRLTNEDALMAELEPLGFKCYELSSLPFIEKVALFAAAKVVISASGAGMNNVMFCQPGFTFFEIFPEGLVHTQFYNLAHALGCDYHYMICHQKHAEGLEEGIKGDTYVNLEEFKAKLLSIPALAATPPVPTNPVS